MVPTAVRVVAKNDETLLLQYGLRMDMPKLRTNVAATTQWLHVYTAYIHESLNVRNIYDKML